MGGGKFLRGGKRPRLSTRQLVLLILAGVQLILAGLCALGLHRVRHTLITQSAAAAWRGESEMRFAQLSVFLPNDNLATEDDIRTFRQTLDSSLVTASLEAPEGGSLYDDSALARLADIYFKVQIDHESDPFDMCASASCTAYCAVWDAIAFTIMRYSGYTKDDLLLIHSGGKVGELLMSK